MCYIQHNFFDKKNNNRNGFDSFDKLSSYSSNHFGILNFVQSLLHIESETSSRKIQK